MYSKSEYKYIQSLSEVVIHLRIDKCYCCIVFQLYLKVVTECCIFKQGLKNTILAIEQCSSSEIVVTLGVHTVHNREGSTL